MLNYLEKTYQKLRDDALAKVIYDFIKYLFGLVITLIFLNYSPQNKITTFLQKEVTLTYFVVFLCATILVIIVVIIQALFFKKKFNSIKKDLYSDELTGLLNEKAFRKQLPELLLWAKKEKITLSIILMDIDNFKDFNTNYGQKVADEILGKVGGLLKSDNRASDTIFRQHLKGDEFVIVAKDTSLEFALKAANRKRELIFNISIQTKDSDETLKLSVCCGVVELNLDIDDEVSIMQRVHKAMLKAKEIEGKNNSISLI
jgi:diguanylate cyclase (GGDEF)-like protein